MKCWIVYNGFLTSEKFIDYANMLGDAAKASGHETTILKNNEIPIILNKANHNGCLEKPDYVLFTDKDIYLAKQLEYLGIPVFNSSETIEICDDKIKTYQLLAQHKIPIPITIVSPKTYGLPIQLDTAYIAHIKNTLGFPLIIKEAFGSFGEQVFLIHDEEELMDCVQKRAGKTMMFQKFIHTSYGKDLRLQVVGDKVICAMMRVSENDFRANITNGGEMIAYEPSLQEQKIAIAASQAIGADFSGVDLLLGEKGEAIICEVNSNAHIRNLLDCTGINAAFPIIQYVENKLGAVRK